MAAAMDDTGQWGIEWADVVAMLWATAQAHEEETGIKVDVHLF